MSPKAADTTSWPSPALDAMVQDIIWGSDPRPVIPVAEASFTPRPVAPTVRPAPTPRSVPARRNDPSHRPMYLAVPARKDPATPGVPERRPPLPTGEVNRTPSITVQDAGPITPARRNVPTIRSGLRDRRYMTTPLSDVPTRRNSPNPVPVAPAASVPTEEDGDCPICIEPFRGYFSRVTLRCGHSYHPNCINRWTRTTGHSVRCPYCRARSLTHICGHMMGESALVCGATLGWQHSHRPCERCRESLCTPPPEYREDPHYARHFRETFRSTADFDTHERELRRARGKSLAACRYASSGEEHKAALEYCYGVGFRYENDRQSNRELYSAYYGDDGDNNDDDDADSSESDGGIFRGG